MLGAALQLSAACALVAHAIYQLRRLARTQAALASAEVRASGSPPTAAMRGGCVLQALQCTGWSRADAAVALRMKTPKVCVLQEEARFAMDERRAERAGRVKAEVRTYRCRLVQASAGPPMADVGCWPARHKWVQLQGARWVPVAGSVAGCK